MQDGFANHTRAKPFNLFPMNFTPKTLKAIAISLIVIQVVAFIYMIKTTWKTDNEMPGSFFLIFILPLFSTLLFNKAKKIEEAEKPQ